MKKIMDGKRYDTETAELCAEWENSFGYTDFNWCRERLYQKKTGEFFLYGEGNAMSKYARSIGNNSWGSGEELIPLTYTAAQKWAEEKLDGDEYEAIFGEVEEDDSKQTVTLSLPGNVVSRLKQMASKTGKTQSDLVAGMIMRGVRYTVFITGGDQDGKEIGWFDDEMAAIKFAKAYTEAHEDEFDLVCGGVAISDNQTNEILTDW